jgi:hypothetical protein
MAIETVPDRFVKSFNAYQGQYMAVPMPSGMFQDNVQTTGDDLIYRYEPYLVTPRLIQLQDWLVAPSKNTNYYLYQKCSTAQLIIRNKTNMVIGDGIKPKVYLDEDLKEEDVDATNILRKWIENPCGRSSDWRGISMDSFVLPWIVLESHVFGHSCWHKYVGMKGFDDPVDAGRLYLRRIDPRTFVMVEHPFTGRKKLMQYRIVQPGIPETEEDWLRWNPTIKNRYQEHYNISRSVEMPSLHIPSEDYYRFNPFLHAPFNTILQDITSELVIKFLRDKFIEKATYPFFIVSVPRNDMTDPDDAAFDDKLNNVAKLLSSYRAGDCFAIEGERYRVASNREKVLLDEGWKIEILDVTKAHIDFDQAIRGLRESISEGLYSSHGIFSGTGQSGKVTTYTVGSNVVNMVILDAQMMRGSIRSVFKDIFRDVLYFETGRLYGKDLIDMAFTKIREEDAAQFLNQLISYHGAGALTTNELRGYGDRIGMELKPFPAEMTPEGQAALGITELLDDDIFDIPSSWLSIKNPQIEMEKVREEITKEKEKQANANKEGANRD